MELSKFYNLSDQLKYQKVLQGSENNLETFKEAAEKVAQGLVLISDHATHPYTPEALFFTAVNARITTDGGTPGETPDVTALGELLALVEVPATFIIDADFISSLIDSYQSVPHVFYLIDGECSPITIIPAVHLTNGLTVTTSQVVIPSVAKTLTIAMKLETVTSPTTILKMATSIDNANYGEFSEINRATAAGVFNTIIDVTTRPKFLKFKIEQTGIATVTLIGGLK
jgi:hypothetical protein